MKTVRQFLLAAAMLLAYNTMAQKTAQSIEPFASSTIQFEMPRTVAVSGVDKAESSDLRIVIEVRADISEKNFQRIAANGRYTFSSLSQADKTLKLTLPNLSKEVKVDGAVWREESVQLRLVSGSNQYAYDKSRQRLSCQESKSCKIEKAIPVEIRFISTTPPASSNPMMRTSTGKGDKEGKLGDILINDVLIPDE